MTSPTTIDPEGSGEPPCTCAAAESPVHLHAQYCARYRPASRTMIVLNDPTDAAAIRADVAASRFYRGMSMAEGDPIRRALREAQRDGDPAAAVAYLSALDGVDVYVPVPLGAYQQPPTDFDPQEVTRALRRVTTDLLFELDADGYSEPAAVMAEVLSALAVAAPLLGPPRPVPVPTTPGRGRLA